MAKQFTKTRLTAAVSAAVVGLGLSTAASAVVVVGGDNGWEVSFDGNVNAFYVTGDYDRGWNPLGYVEPSAAGAFGGTDIDVSRVTSGFLPAFFSFNVKSPTVNGMTGSARISFSPTIQNSNGKNQLYAPGTFTGIQGGTNNGIQGASIDTREVVVNLDGAFGTVSFGRTLSIFGRNAILKDMTLFGVGISNVTGGTVTAGRIGRGYTYPNFNARFSYKTPNLKGFQAEVGLYDPSREQLTALIGGVMPLNQTDTPRFEAEGNYTTTFSGGSFQVWMDGLWQDIETTVGSGDVTVSGFGVGSSLTYAGANVVGYWYNGEGLGRSLQFAGGTRCDATGIYCQEADNDGFYVQGTYTFNGATKVGVSYGESNQDRLGAIAGMGATRDVELNMYTVGVYHDINSWLRVIAEYSKAENDFSSSPGFVGANTESDTFSVGSFFFW